MRLAILLGIVGVLLSGVALADFANRPEVQAFVDDLAAEHDFEPAQLQALFAGAQRQQRIIDAISRPAERVLEWHEYRNIFMTDSRISQGVEFWQENQAALDRAEREYGVPPAMIVAIIGVETMFGRNKGSWRVLDALATLTFDYPPRSSFFRRELTEFLLLAREEGKDPLSLHGSYAGAMGYGQFIPSSYRAYAVDFNGDGVRDIWHNATDAIGSVANYFKVHGWDPQRHTVRRVAVDSDNTDALITNALPLSQTVGELRRAGVQTDGLADDEAAVLMRMRSSDQSEYWLGLHNFYVITRYNHSSMYALAVHQLSEAIADAYAVAHERDAS